MKTKPSALKKGSDRAPITLLNRGRRLEPEIGPSALKKSGRLGTYMYLIIITNLYNHALLKGHLDNGLFLCIGP